MLREIEGIGEEPRTRRRWFHDEYFDLFVWQTDVGEVTLFQLCYGIDARARSHGIAWAVFSTTARGRLPCPRPKRSRRASRWRRMRCRRISARP